MMTEITKRNGDNGDAVTQALPAWMVKIREAVTGAVKTSDIQEIFEKQVELAKRGDRNAAKFVLDQVRAFTEIRGITIAQTNNHFHGEQPTAPTKAMPGTDSKIKRMQQRAAMGQELTREEDGPRHSLD